MAGLRAKVIPAALRPSIAALRPSITAIPFWPILLLPILLLLLLPATVAGALPNPQISAVLEPYLRITDDPLVHDRNRLRPDPGRTELVLEGHVNPYFNGFVTAVLRQDSAALEEGYFTMVGGLPAGLMIKGGRYGFRSAH